MRSDNRHRNLYEDPVATLAPHYDLSLFLMACLSHSVLVFLRRDIGYRLLQPWLFALFFFLLAGLGYKQFTTPHMPPPAHTGGEAVMVFAALMLLLFFFHRRRGWAGIFSEERPVHTMSRGSSLLTPLLLIVPEIVIQRWVEPFLLIGLGYHLATHQHWFLLGWWVACAGAALAGVEDHAIRQSRHLLMDLRDSQFEAQMLANAQANIKAKRPSAQPRRRKEVKAAIIAPELLRREPGRRPDETPPE